jgi:hypothetical protein
MACGSAAEHDFETMCVAAHEQHRRRSVVRVYARNDLAPEGVVAIRRRGH